VSRVHQVRPWQFLRVAGVLPAWHLPLFLLIAGYAVYTWRLNGPREEGLAMWMIVFPLASGTGLLAAARAGKLDLLFGARVTRRRAFAVAFAWAVGLPALLAVLLVPMSLPLRGDSLLQAMLRTLGAALFLGGCCFAAAMAGPRYAPGAAWIAARILFIMNRSALKFVAAVSSAKYGSPMPPPWKILGASLLFPELVLQSEVPLYIPLALGVLGMLAAATALAAFERADFHGHRSV
jgi:hypothetical protein